MPVQIARSRQNPMTCCVCNSADAAGLFTAAGHRIVTCRSCGMVYTGDFREEEARYSEKAYFDGSYVERWDQFCHGFQSLVDKIRGYKSGGALLDVGTGVGALLHVARESGFAVRGVELSSWASRFARDEKGLDVICGTLEEAAFRAETFDVVVVNHVLEHVPDPAALLREARRILKKDGLLVLGIPNIGSIMARLAGPRWASLRPEEHRWHFAPDTIKALVAKQGFRRLRFEARDNHAVVGWSLKGVLRRLVNCTALVANRGEAMLLFAAKDDEGRP